MDVFCLSGQREEKQNQKGKKHTYQENRLAIFFTSFWSL
mgnify:CR=1 FL=1